MTDVTAPGAVLTVTAGMVVSSAHLGDGYGMGNYGEDPDPLDAYGTPRHNINASFVGTNLTATVSIAAGSLITDADVSGTVLTVNAGIAAGRPLIATIRPGADLLVGAVLAPGSVTAGGSLVVSGAHLNVAASISAGSASVSYAVSGAALGVAGSLLPGPLAMPGVDFLIPVLYQPGFPFILVDMAVPGRDIYASAGISGSSIHGGSEWDEVVLDDDDFGPWIPQPPPTDIWVPQPLVANWS